MALIEENYPIANISDCIDNRIEGLSETDIKRIVSSFYSIAPHARTFLRNSAEDFARQRKAVTCFRAKLKELRAKSWGSTRCLLLAHLGAACMPLELSSFNSVLSSKYRLL